MQDRPRIAPIGDEDLTDFQRELLGQVGGVVGEVGTVANIFRTLVRHPGLFRRWLPFGGKLLAGRLPARDRELMILRTAFNCRSPYEWAQHVRVGRDAGLSSAEIERATAPPSSWDGFDRLLIMAADELHTRASISAPTWQGLSERYDEHQMIEVPMLVGHYHLVAFTLNSLGVPLEADADAAGSDEWTQL